METQGKEYQEIFGKKPKKPTDKEIKEWWEEQKKSPSERIRMPGEAETKKEKYYYTR